ncbi:hypothetical protein Ccrd_021518 [Cynara cardunculus var. scolymus]|uniref:Uncharacterized protein n=1 Tax=Cynara cardunculus var. scolymus TaxID=59895 RepID=A0A103Y0H6_CYNCS|nr:hypothetical protein Ccrd_021518 [Cynara cardunculus var. scolymus]
MVVWMYHLDQRTDFMDRTLYLTSVDFNFELQ